MIFQIAMNYLPIQASSVPCERVFSLSAETDTKRRNHTGPVLMEALQMLKFEWKKKQLNFTRGWAPDYGILVQDDPDVGGVEVNHGEDHALDIVKVKHILDDEDMMHPGTVKLLE